MKKRFDLGLRAETLLPMRGGHAEPESNRFLGIRGGIIEEVGAWKPAYAKDCRTLIDGAGAVALPGLVNGHNHLAMSLFRGLEDDVPLHTWLFERIFKLEAALVSKRFVADGTALAALECIRFGVTCVNEMYFYPEVAARVLDEAGLRGLVSQAFTKFPIPEDKDVKGDAFARAARLGRRLAGHRRLRAAYAPHAPYSCSDELLTRVAAEAAAAGAPIHIHVSETAKEVEESLAEYGLTPVGRLKRLGVLRPGTICAHCVHLNGADQELFRESGAAAVYNPDSNCKLGSGIAPVANFQRLGIPWCFGTDGAASNNDLSLFGAMDLGTKLQKLAAGDTTALSASQALVAATFGGARALGLSDEIGSLEPGKRADFILVGLEHAHLQPVNDVVSHLVYSAQGLEVRTTVVEGKVLFDRGRFRTLDLKAVHARAAGWRRKILSQLRGLR